MRAALGLVLLAAGAETAPIAILPLGDSITYGCGDQCGLIDCMKTADPVCPKCAGGYRTSLWRQLNTSKPGGYKFVGTQENGPDDIDPHHEGHPGWTCEQIQGIANNSWGQTNPDVILLHLGTNNMGIHFQSAEEALGHMDDLLGVTFGFFPNVRLLLATLIGAGKEYGGDKHVAYNQGLGNLTQKYSAAKRNIQLIPMEEESGLGDHCDIDGDCCPLHIHPNDKGYVKMANVWFKYITSSSTTTQPRVDPPCHYLNNDYCKQANTTSDCSMDWEKSGDCASVGFPKCCVGHYDIQLWYKAGTTCSGELKDC